MQDVLKEFLVKLTYQIDSASHAKFEKGLKGATDAAIGLGKAVAVAAAAVSLAVAKIGKDLDDLYYQAQRNQAAASSIRAMGYAVSQLGGSYQSAIGTIEAFGAKMRQNPGYESMAKQLGVMTRQNGKLRDTVDIIRDIGSALKDKPYAVQFAYAQAFGIDEATWRAIQSGEMTKRMDEYRAKARDLGVDTELAAKRGNEFWTAMRSLNAVLGLIGEKMALELLPSLTEFVKRVEAFLTSNADSIVAFFKEMGILAGKLGDMLRELLKIMHPLWEMFDKWAQSLTGHSGLAVALTAIIAIKMAAWLMGIATAILAVGAASNAALLSGSLGRFLGMLGVAVVGARVGVLSSGVITGAEAESALQGLEKRREDSQKSGGTWGKIKRWWKGDGGQKSGGDPSGGASAGGAPKNKLAAAKESYAFWRSKGLSHEQALGVTANEMQESGFNPNARGDGGSSHGLYQWQPPRRRAIENATGINVSTANAQQQREAAFWESTQGKHDPLAMQGWRLLKEAKTSGEAAAIWSKYFERPKASWEGEHRAKIANGLGRQITGVDGVARVPSHGGYKLPPMPRVQGAAGFIPTLKGQGVAPWATFNVPPLAPANAGDSNVSITQRTEINMTGSSDPAGTASAIADQQKSVNSGLQRNVQRAVQ